MSSALAPPFVVAAVVLCVAGAFKLRSPEVAAGALGTLGLPGRTGLVRCLAAAELVLGATCAIDPTRATAGLLAAAYVALTGVAAALVGRQVGCGCFGEADTPVSRVHVVANLALGAVALAAALASPRGLGWLASQPVGEAVALGIGIAGAVYATMLVYTQTPAAWAAWSPE